MTTSSTAGAHSRRVRRRKTVNPDGAMTLMEHLQELRKRLFLAALAIVVGSVIGFVFFEPIFNFLKQPYCDIPADIRADLNNKCALIASGPLDQFKVRFKLSLVSGTILTAPFWLYQLWAFITPGLKRNEKKIAVLFVGCGSALFFAGAALAYVTLSKGLQLLLSFAPGTLTLLQVTEYLSFITTMLLVFGLAFQFPLVVVMLNAIGVLPHARLRGWWRSMVFGIFVFAGVATPSQDPYTMSAMAGALCLLYGVALVFTSAHDRRKARREAAEEAEIEQETISDQPSDISAWIDDDVS